MPYRNLDEFLIRLEQSEELITINQPISADLALTTLTEQAARTHNKALWFSHVAGSAFPVVSNLFGSEQRLAWGLGLESLADLETRLNHILDIDLPPTMAQVMGRVGELMRAVRTPGRSVQTAPVQAVRLPPDIRHLPRLRGWPEEPHPTLRGVQIITSAAGKQRVRYGWAVMMPDGRLGLPHHPLDTAGAAVALVLGGDPAAMWAASADLPLDLDPYWLAGWLRGKPLMLVPGVSQPVQVPTDAEIIIEGIIQSDAVVRCGPFAGEDGCYIPHVDFLPVEITAITHREDAFFPVSVILPPPSEQMTLQRAAERLFTAMLRRLYPGLIDIHCPVEGAFRHLAIVRVNAHHMPQVRRLIHGLWAFGPLTHIKTIVVVDEDAPYDLAGLIQHLLHHVDWSRDVMVVEGELHPDDPSGGFGGKLAVDATCKACGVHAEASGLEADPLTALIGTRWRLWYDRVLVIPSAAAPDAALRDQVAALCPEHHLIFADNVEDLPAHALLPYALHSVDWRRDLTIENNRVRLQLIGRGAPLVSRTKDHASTRERKSRLRTGHVRADRPAL
ncbi:MAG: UbiD family decarboxylase [Anaerolineae bacterium]